MGWHDILHPTLWSLERQAQATPEVLRARTTVRSAGCGVRTPGLRPGSTLYQPGQSVFLVKPQFLHLQSGNHRILWHVGLLEDYRGS